ncbi:MAG TPA: hypothetical protein VF609_09545 [Flavisolibacter sp.]|jgi:hypothetical protein
MDNPHLQEVAAFIKEHRSNEGNFEKLYAKLEEETGNATTNGLHNSINDIQTKADEYRKAKENGGTAWPEFEKFVSEFEKAVMKVLHG